jgi:hypothetical protein
MVEVAREESKRSGEAQPGKAGAVQVRKQEAQRLCFPLLAGGK